MRSVFLLWLSLPISLLAEGYFPSSNLDWETTDAANAGAALELLDEAIAYAGENNSNALVILHKGKILSENYWNGFDRNSTGPGYSVTKSIVSVLVGQAIQNGLINSVDQTSGDFLQEWSGKAYRSGISLKHHLTMTTGFRERQFGILLLQSSANERAFAVSETLSYEAGERWWYNDAAYRLLFYILEEASESPLPEYSMQKLFQPIGMESVNWVIRIGNENDGTQIDNYQWVEFSALDAARFGLLALRNGKWNGVEIVSEEWMLESRRPQTKAANWYGYLWWLNNSPHHRVPIEEEPRSGPFAPDAPPDLFAALGALDQKIYVIPSLDLVIVRLGEEADESSLAVGSFDNKLLGRICRAFGYDGQKEPLAVQNQDGKRLSLSMPIWSDREHSVETSTNLTDWEPASKEPIKESGTLFFDTDIPSTPSYFLRLHRTK